MVNGMGSLLTEGEVWEYAGMEPGIITPPPNNFGNSIGAVARCSSKVQ